LNSSLNRDTEEVNRLFQAVEDLDHQLKEHGVSDNKHTDHTMDVLNNNRNELLKSFR